jgi:hypothetical protein
MSFGLRHFRHGFCQSIPNHCRVFLRHNEVPVRCLSPSEVVRECAGGVPVEGNLAIPDAAHSVVLFAHGSGGSCFSPGNRSAANSVGIANEGKAAWMFRAATTNGPTVTTNAR